MKIDNDFKEKVKTVGLFMLQSYRIIMGTMITLVVPQKCVYEITQYDNAINSTVTVTKDKLCSFNDNLNNMDNLTFSLNCIAGIFFVLLYFIEVNREYWLIKTFDIDHNYADNNLSIIFKNSNTNKIKSKLYKYNSNYFNIVVITSVVFLINNIFAVNILMNKSYGSSSFNTYIGFLLLILLKLKNSIYVSYYSKKNHQAMSSFMTEYSSFNVLDEDVTIPNIIDNEEVIINIEP